MTGRLTECPRCGASATAHTGTYCQECGESLFKDPSVGDPPRKRPLGRLTPDSISVQLETGPIEPGRHPLELTRNGARASSRTEGGILLALREIGQRSADGYGFPEHRSFRTPACRIVVDVRESCGANFATLAEWIAEAIAAGLYVGSAHLDRCER